MTVLEVEIFDNDDIGNIAIARYLYRGYDDVYWTNNMHDVLSVLHEDLLRLGGENMLKTYVGTKIIKAEPMSEKTFALYHGKPTSTEDREGYKVVYPDGYESWSPREAFENAYREVTFAEKEMM